MTDPFDFDRPADAYGVMGNPIGHSKSPQIHSLFARQTGQRIVYDAILVDHGGLAQACGNFQAAGGKGLNITVPFKQDAWRWVDKRSERAQMAGAVNTIRFEADGSSYGDNTDGVGLIRDLQANGIELKGRRILLMGAGGAVRGVLQPLLQQFPLEILLVNRTLDKAQHLAADFTNLGQLRVSSYQDLPAQSFDVIINGTAASLQGDLPPLPDKVISSDSICYDMMYGPGPTQFLQWCQARGAQRYLDGLGMLVEQAAESFFLWRGVRPETRSVVQTLREQLLFGK